MVGHACLVEDDGRVGTDVDAARVRSREECVEREGLSLERWTVGTQSLGRGPGDGDPESFLSGELHGPCGRVDHDALPGASRSTPMSTCSTTTSASRYRLHIQRKQMLSCSMPWLMNAVILSGVR